MKVAIYSGIFNVGVRTNVEYLLREGHVVDLYLEAHCGGDLYDKIAPGVDTENLRVFEPEPLPSSTVARMLHAAKYLGKAASRHPQLFASILKSPHERRFHGRSSLLCLAYTASQIPRNGREYDIMHAHSAVPGRRLALLKRSAVLSGRMVVSFKGMDITRFVGKPLVRRYDWMLEELDACTVQTEFMRGVVKEAGVPEAHIHKVPSCVDIERFPQKSDEEIQSGTPDVIRCITVARFVELKGHKYSIQAMGELVRRGYEVEYTMLGEGPLRHDMMTLAEELDLQQICRFPGRVPLEKVYAELKDHEIFVLAGIVGSDNGREAMGLASLEAQYVGLPAVVGHVGGLPETLVSPTHGAIVDARKIHNLADAMITLKERQHEWPQIIADARRYIRQSFSIQEMAGRYDELYASLLTP